MIERTANVQNYVWTHKKRFSFLQCFTEKLDKINNNKKKGIYFKNTSNYQAQHSNSISLLKLRQISASQKHPSISSCIFLPGKAQQYIYKTFHAWLNHSAIKEKKSTWLRKGTAWVVILHLHAVHLIRSFSINMTTWRSSAQTVMGSYYITRGGKHKWNRSPADLASFPTPSYDWSPNTWCTHAVFRALAVRTKQRVYLWAEISKRPNRAVSVCVCACVCAGPQSKGVYESPS